MNGNCYSSDGINPTLTCNKNEGNRVAIPAADIDTNHLYNQRGTVHDVNGIARTLVGCNQHSGSGNEPKVAIPVLTPDRANKRQNGRRFKEDGEEAFSLTTQDRHGVAVEVKPEVIGGIGDKCCGTQYRQGNRIYDGDKIATALESHPVGNAGGYTNLYSVDVTGYNATLKRGGGVTQTALTLCARDGSGLSGSRQMMTAAAICLQLTKESDQKSEQKPIASPPERTEDSADTNRKEP